MTITTTLNAIGKHAACSGDLLLSSVRFWSKLLASLGKTSADDEPLPLLHILESNGIYDALWCTRTLGPEHDRWVRLLACDFAEAALKYVPDGETRPADAIRVARRYANSEATQEELAAAWAAAKAAEEALNAYDWPAWAAARGTEDALAAYDWNPVMAAMAAASAANPDCATTAFWAGQETTAHTADLEQILRAALAHEYRTDTDEPHDG